MDSRSLPTLDGLTGLITPYNAWNYVNGLVSASLTPISAPPVQASALVTMVTDCYNDVAPNSAQQVTPGSAPFLYNSANMPRFGYRLPCSSSRQNDTLPAVICKYEHVKPVIDSLPADLSYSERSRAIELVNEYQDVFSRHEFDYGQTNLLMHTIDTGNHRPIAQPLRRHPRVHLQLIDDTTEKMRRADVIEPAASPWSFNVVLVSRPGSSTPRVTIDYHSLHGSVELL